MEHTKTQIDQYAHYEIAISDGDWRVCLQAFEKITNQKLIEKIAVEAKLPEIRTEAIEKLPNDAVVLAEIAVKDPDWNFRVAAVDRLVDQALLQRIASEDTNPSVRVAAVDKLTDQVVLTKIAVEDTDPSVRVAAVNKLTDKTALAKIAKNDMVWRVHEAATRRQATLH